MCIGRTPDLTLVSESLSAALTNRKVLEQTLMETVDGNMGRAN